MNELVTILTRQMGISLTEIMAIGDGLDVILLLSGAGLAIAIFCGDKPGLAWQKIE